MKKDKAKRITLYLDEDIYKEFKLYAVIINMSVSKLIEEYMERTIRGIENEKIEKLG